MWGKMLIKSFRDFDTKNDGIAPIDILQASMAKYCGNDVHYKDPMVDLIFSEAIADGHITADGNLDYPSLVKAIMEEPDPLELPEDVLEEQLKW